MRLCASFPGFPGWFSEKPVVTSAPQADDASVAARDDEDITMLCDCFEKFSLACTRKINWFKWKASWVGCAPYVGNGGLQWEKEGIQYLGAVYRGTRTFMARNWDKLVSEIDNR